MKAKKNVSFNFIAESITFASHKSKKATEKEMRTTIVIFFIQFYSILHILQNIKLTQEIPHT